MSDHVNGYRKTNGRRGFAMKILKRAWIPVVIVVVVAAGGAHRLAVAQNFRLWATDCGYQWQR